MAYSETLAERIRDVLDSYPDLEEKKMFGGIAFMIRGNMVVGVSGEGLIRWVETAVGFASTLPPK